MPARTATKTSPKANDALALLKKDGAALPAYVDPDAGRAPGVPYGVGQRLLREPVERGVHGSCQPGQRTVQRDLDGGRRVGARQSRQVRDTQLR